MTARPGTKLVALLVLTMVMVLAGALLYWAAVRSPDALWISWTYVADPGSHVGEASLSGRLAGAAITLTGFFTFALLVGLVADGITSRVDELRRGRSRVIERGHTLVLGWSDKLLPLLHEFALANASEGGGVVVVLAERDKQAMEEDIADGAGDLLGTMVVCRTGSPLHVADLHKVGAEEARSVVVLAIGEDADDADARTTRVVLALCRGLEAMEGHVVVELKKPANRELLALVGGDRVETVVAEDMLGRLMIQCARQPGLAQVYASMLGFDGNEFYLADWPTLTGKAFGEIRRSFPAAIACGVRRDGRVQLNPPDDLVMRAGDELLALAEDNDTYQPGAPVSADSSDPGDWQPPVDPVERILFCGGRRNLHQMVAELGAYVPPGSELTILSNVSAQVRAAALAKMTGLENLTIRHVEGNPISRQALEDVGVEQFDSVLILAEDGWGSPTDTDSRSLVSLLLVRDIRRQRDAPEVVLISEILDPRTKRLVSVTQVSDYVVSNELVSMALATVAERREIADVWTELFSADGQEIYLRDARHYVRPGDPASFRDIAERARGHDELAIGYRVGNDTLHLNPADKGTVRTWGEGDIVVVIAET